jgi:hypothetical protein
MPDTITPEQYQKWLELAPKDVLKQTAKGLLIGIDNTLDDPPHLEIFNTMLSMLDYELRLREIEPLWRKAKRFTFRNSAIAKEITVRNLTAVKELTVKNSDTIEEIGKLAVAGVNEFLFWYFVGMSAVGILFLLLWLMGVFG